MFVSPLFQALRRHAGARHVHVAIRAISAAMSFAIIRYTYAACYICLRLIITRAPRRLRRYRGEAWQGQEGRRCRYEAAPKRYDDYDMMTPRGRRRRCRRCRDTPTRDAPTTLADAAKCR